MTRTMKRLVLTVLTAPILLAGCSDSEPEPNSGDQQASQTVESPSETPTKLPSPPPPPLPDKDGDGVPDETDAYPRNPLASTLQEIKIGCGGAGNFTIDRVKLDFSKVWARRMPKNVYCEYWGRKLTPVNGVEQRLWDADKRPSVYTISIPYEQCVEHGTPWMRNEWPVSPNQVHEAETALLLCPDHPDGPAIRTRIADQGALTSELKNSRAFYDGNYRVGKGVEPGTYFTTDDVENCYWERLDANGEIIDNNFVSKAFRVEATIASSDFSFHTEGCGLWRQVK